MHDDTMLWVRSILTSTPERWKRLAETLPVELQTRCPAAQEWSASECLYHILDIEALFCSRLRAFQAGQDFPAFDPDTQGSRPDPHMPLRQVAEEFAAQRARSLELLAQVQPADLDRQVIHQELGPVRLVELINEWAAHDLNHTIQAEEALMQPFIQGCGPWQVYFEEHIAHESG